MTGDRRIMTVDDRPVDSAILRTVLPILFERLDYLTLQDATQTNSYSTAPLRELRMTLSTIAGALGFLGPDCIEDLRKWVQEYKADG